MKFRLFINCLICSVLFNLWQNSILAGMFMLVLLGCLLSIIDYFKQKE